MRALAALALVALLWPLPAAAANAAPQSVCYEREDVIAHLARKYRERVAGVGLANGGGLVELLTSDGGQTWTIIVSLPNGQSCLMAAGENWRPGVVPATRPQEMSL